MNTRFKIWKVVFDVERLDANNPYDVSLKASYDALSRNVHVWAKYEVERRSFAFAIRRIK